MNYIVILACSLLCFAVNSSVYAQGKENYFKWNDRGLFIFGPLLMDFNKDDGVEVVLNRSKSKLINCSNKEFYCAQGRNVNLVLPRKCDGSLRVGKTWHLGEVTTSVLYAGKENPPLKKVIADTYLIGSELNPSIVWTYRLDTGINGVYFDSDNKENLVYLAKNGGTETLNKNLSSRKFGFFELFTLDAFGYCAN